MLTGCIGLSLELCHGLTRPNGPTVLVRQCVEHPGMHLFFLPVSLFGPVPGPLCYIRDTPTWYRSVTLDSFAGQLPGSQAAPVLCSRLPNLVTATGSRAMYRGLWYIVQINRGRPGPGTVNFGEPAPG